MTESELKQMKFPIGEFVKPDSIDQNQVEEWIAEIAAFPERLKKLVTGLSIEQLQWRYRPEGWMIKQLIHHCADSHMNSLMRFKLALTEDSPEIRPYWEDRWAELTDSHDNDVSDSLMLIQSLHQKWVKLLKSLNSEELKKEFVHPEHGTRVALDENIGIYAWHSNHHLAHVNQAIELKGCFPE